MYKKYLEQFHAYVAILCPKNRILQQKGYVMFVNNHLLTPYLWGSYFLSGEKILLKLLSSEWIHYPLTLQILAEGNISRTISWLTKYSLFQPPSNFVQYCTNAVQYKKFLPIKSIRVGWTYSMIICINLYSYSSYLRYHKRFSFILSLTEWMKIIWW